MSTHSDPAVLQKAIRKYYTIGVVLLICTVLTVAANKLHLAVGLAITVALAIAITKGSMVAAVFMHLSDEKKWIYGALILTVIFFIAVMLLPNLTVADSIGTPLMQAR